MFQNYKLLYFVVVKAYEKALNMLLKVELINND